MKQWPIAYFSELARLLADAGNEMWVLGSAGERALGEEIRAAGARPSITSAAALPPTPWTCSPRPARPSATTPASCMLAAAAGTHVIALYGSSTPAFTPRSPPRSILYLDLDCSPCFERTCPSAT